LSSLELDKDANLDKNANIKNEQENEIDLEEAAAELAAAYAKMEKELVDVQVAKTEQDNQMLRLRADFDNFRKRTRQEKENWLLESNINICSQLLVVLDNFQRALAAFPKDEQKENYVAGIEMIYRQLNEILLARGMEKIPAVGEVFDPNWHEAIGQEVTKEPELDGIIATEEQTGYRIDSKLIRPSQVRVNKFEA